MNKKIYWTSDWHIGHKAVIDFSNRPFKDCDDMHRVLINNYNSTVGTHDICYFLGDMGMTAGPEIKKVVQKLNGTKILVQGNHDKKGRQFWMDCGFVTVMNTGSIVIAKQMVTFSHCPLRGVFREDTTNMRGAKPGEMWHKEERHGPLYSLPDFGQFHLHGHTHAPNNGKSTVKQDKQWDIGVDGNKYRPVSISQVESWVAKYES